MRVTLMPSHASFSGAEALRQIEYKDTLPARLFIYEPGADGNVSNGLGMEPFSIVLI